MGAKTNLASLACGNPADDDIELLPSDDGGGKIHREETRKVLARSRWDRNIGYAAGHLTLNGMSVGGGERVAAVERRSEREHIGGQHLRPVDGGDAAGWDASPINHQLVRVYG